MKDWRLYNGSEGCWARDYRWTASGVYWMLAMISQRSEEISAVIWPLAYPSSRVNDFGKDFYANAEDFGDLDSAAEWCNNKVAELRVETTLKYS